jgi:hypothetical protein
MLPTLLYNNQYIFFNRNCQLFFTISITIIKLVTYAYLNSYVVLSYTNQDCSQMSLNYYLILNTNKEILQI